MFGNAQMLELMVKSMYEQASLQNHPFLGKGCRNSETFLLGVYGGSCGMYPIANSQVQTKVVFCCKMLSVLRS